jgi:hypothetical protein
MNLMQRLCAVSIAGFILGGCVNLRDTRKCSDPLADQSNCDNDPAVARPGGGDSRPDAGTKVDTPRPHGGEEGSAGDTGGNTPTGDPDCDPGFHRCAGVCVNSKELASCGVACDPCPPIAGGESTCDGAKCGVRCPADKKVCPASNSCVGLDDPCDGTCPPGKNLCNGSCVLATEKTACGPSCTACPTPANGKAECDGTQCVLTCNPGSHRCFDSLVDGKLVPSCDASCTPCPMAMTGSACPPGNCTNVSDGTSCGNTQLCRAGTCVDCGGMNQPCCGTSCNATGLSCQAGSCKSCGGNGQPCCDGSCSNGLTCENGTTCVVPCGSGPGQKCCEGAMGGDCQNDCGTHGKQTCKNGQWTGCSVSNPKCCEGEMGGDCQDTCGKHGKQTCRSGQWTGCSINTKPACCNEADCGTCRTCSSSGTCQNRGEKNNECGGLGCNAGSCKTCSGKMCDGQCIGNSECCPKCLSGKVCSSNACKIDRGGDCTSEPDACIQGSQCLGLGHCDDGVTACHMGDVCPGGTPCRADKPFRYKCI